MGNAISEKLPTDEPPSATEEVAKLRLQLRQYSLSELEQRRFIRVDEDLNVVKKGPDFPEKRIEQ